MRQDTERTEDLFEPVGEHRSAADRLTLRWAEAQALAQRRLMQRLAHRRQSLAEEEPVAPRTS